jgi:formylglycine-generating enzyme required for sulfatase activity
VAMAGGLGAQDRYPWDPLEGPVTEDEGAILARANVREARLGGTSPVAMYPSGQSPPGVWDMGGNVWEWLAFEKGEYPLRGGSWCLNQEYARVRERYRYNPGRSGDLIGFRVVAFPAGSEF